MGYKTKIQKISRTKGEQFYVNFPTALAHALELEKGEMVEWVVLDNCTLTLRRTDANVLTAKKKLTLVT